MKTRKMMEASAPGDHNSVTVINPWPRLSDEIVLLILRHLPRKDLVKVSLINKRFRDLSRDDSLWTELTLDFDDIKLKADSCRKLVERCKKLASIKISNKNVFNWDVPLNIMTVVIRAKDTLKRLEVDSLMRTWRPAAMAKLGQMKKLTFLSMSFCSDTLAVNGYAGAEMLQELSKLDKLEVLNLWITHNCSDRNYSLPTDSATMKSVFEKLKKLKNVKISLPTSYYDESLVTTLAKNNPDLTGLHIMDYPSLSDGCVDLLADSCPGLQEVRIGFSHGPSEIVNEKLVNFVKKFRWLERLDVKSYNITDDGIERVVGAAKSLKYLGGWASKVTYNLVERLRMEYPDVTFSINLQYY